VVRIIVVAAGDLSSDLGLTILWRPDVDRTVIPEPAAVPEAVARWRPNLVIIDVAGVDETLLLVRRLRDDPKTRATAIAVLNRGLPAEAEDRLLSSGVNAVLRLPVDPLFWDRRLEELLSAMRAQIAKLDDEATKSGGAKKGQKPATSLTARLGEIADMSKVHDYLTRDLVIGFGPPSGSAALPFVRYNFVKVKAGKGSDYRKAWEKYNKPVFEKLAADGVVMAYGLSVEEIRTDGDFTHYVWYAVKDLASFDKVRAAFTADRDRRSQEEQDSLTSLFVSLQDADASRSEVGRSLIFHVSAPK